MERFERSEHLREEREHFGRRTAMLIAVMALFLALASLAAERQGEEVLLSQQQAADTFAEFQANSLKRHINEDAAATLKILGAGSSQEARAMAQAAAFEKANAEKYRPTQDKLLPKARQLEEERDHAKLRRNTLQLSEAGLQLAIVLASVSIIARSVPLVLGSGLVGLVGVGLLVGGYSGLVKIGGG